MTARRLFLLSLLLGLASVRPAIADGDAGTGSVFEFGAGNRALAMGSAFSAVADDASAPIWNPAGLGLLQRGELQASQADLYGIDISEQYASLAFPSWRWGTTAFGFRRFGVDGIEQRTERNELLSTGLQDSQTEFRVSYGRAVSSAWNLGASVKMHRQKLAGYSDFGLGLDLGVLVRPGVALGAEGAWTERLSLAAIAQNAVEPTLRLDQDDVADPGVIRGALAYRQPFQTSMLGPGTLLGTIDIAKAKKQDATAHLGLEFVLHSAVALRAGLNDGALTAGAGIRWRGYSFDYVFEDNDLDTLHRFGASIGFGSTLTDRRQAAIDREDSEFRNRLNATFERRQREQVAQLVERGRALLEAGSFDEVLTVAGTVETLDPENTDAHWLRVQALLLNAEMREARGEFAEAAVLYGEALAADPGLTEARVGADRCQASSDRKFARSERIRGLFDGALVAFADGEPQVARVKLRQLLDVAPEDTEAESLLERANTAIRVRVAELTSQAKRFLNLGHLTEADDVLHRARQLDPTDREYAALRSRLLDAQLAAKQRAAEPSLDPPTADAVNPPSASAHLAVKGPALSKKKREEVDDLYRRGVSAMESDRPEDAVRYWELVWTVDPEYKDVSKFMVREYLLRGLEHFTRGDLDEAITIWNRARDVDPTNEKTLSYLDRALQHRERTREILDSRR